MAVKRVSINWNAKLHNSKDLPKYGDSGDGKFSKKFGEGRFVIPAPLEVDALMNKVPKGKLTTINELRTALASKHKTEMHQAWERGRPVAAEPGGADAELLRELGIGMRFANAAYGYAQGMMRTVSPSSRSTAPRTRARRSCQVAGIRCGAR